MSSSVYVPGAWDVVEKKTGRDLAFMEPAFWSREMEDREINTKSR